MNICPDCEVALVASDVICPACGTDVSPRCGQCAAVLSPIAKFCSECGAVVHRDGDGGSADMSSTVVADVDALGLWPEGEKRRLTLLFCDLVGSTSIGQRLDEEDYSDLIEAYVGQAAEAIERHGGYVSQVQGDGIVAYFGFPAAHENDPERAVRAGLAIHESLRQFSGGFGPTSVRFQARVGIHTGPVVLNEVGRARRELLALGDTPNTAARVESVTPPGRVGISETTRRLLGDKFDISPAGLHDVRGIAEPLAVFLIDGVVGRVGVGAALEDRRGAFVGRQVELCMLRDALTEAETGNGRTVVISGEAGIGKSRLIGSVAAEASGNGFHVVKVTCSTFGGADAFVPIVGMILGAIDDDADPQSLTAVQLERRLVELGVPVESTLPYLLALAGQPESPEHPMAILGPELRRERTIEAVVSTMSHIAVAAPQLVVIEDLHWVDPSSLAVLTELAEATSSIPMLLLVTTRPTFRWPRPDTVVGMDRLDTEAARQIVEGAARGLTLEQADVDQIIERADGVPLFLEELTAALVETGDMQSIPTTLQDLLTARLDRLGSARALAQIGSLIGREFDRDVLVAVAKVAEIELEVGLERLVTAGILDAVDSSRYSFRHALIQDAATASLVRKTRRRLHSDIVEVFEASFPGVVESEPARLARHCEAAARNLEAIGHYQRAAAVASARLANAEAIAHLVRALALFEMLDETERTVTLEIALRAAYGGPLASLHGLLGEPVVDNYRALERLEAEAEDVGDKIAGLFALTTRYVQVSEMASLVEAGGRWLDIAAESGMPLFSAIGHIMCGVGGSTKRDPPETLMHIEAVEQLAAEGHVPPPLSNYEPDLQVLAASTKAINLVYLGRISESRERAEFAVRRAQEVLQHASSTGTALTLAASVSHELNEPESCLQSSAQAIELARRHGFIHFEAMNLVQHGWARSAMGGDGSDDIRLGLKLLETSTMSSYTHQLRIAAREALARGDSDEARRYIDQATMRVAATGERHFRSNLEYLSGLLELGEDRPERAAALFVQAFDSACESLHWLPAFQAALGLVELSELSDHADRDESVVKLRLAIGNLVGGDDLPEVLRARSFVGQV